MSTTEAERFVGALADSPELVARIKTVCDNPESVYSLVLSEGFDCTAEEIKEAYLDSHGARLSEEQLEAIAGGLTTGQEVAIGIAVSSGVATGAVVAVAAGASAAI